MTLRFGPLADASVLYGVGREPPKLYALDKALITLSCDDPKFTFYMAAAARSQQLRYLSSLTCA